MLHIGNTPFEREQKRGELLQKFRRVGTFFAIACLLPVLAYAVFALGLLESRPAQASGELQKAVGMLTTSSATGTAFLVSPTTLVTAKHVISGMQPGETVSIVFDQAAPSVSVTAKLKWVDPTPEPNPPTLEFFETDVAILEIENADALAHITPLILGDSDGIKSLDEVIVLGYPGGVPSATKGNINTVSLKNLRLFKLDATSNPGNSGGPVILSTDNTVIGIMVGKNTLTEGENVAIKVNRVRELVGIGGISL